MAKINLHFGRFNWTCKCGYFINYRSFEIDNFKRYLEYAIKSNVDTQSFICAFHCKKCGKVEYLKFLIDKDENYFVVRNGGKL